MQPVCGLRFVGEGGGDEEGGTGHGQGDEEAGPFVGVVEAGVDAGGVEDDDPEEKHQAEERGCEASEDFQGDAGGGGDEACAGEVNPQQVSGEPGRDERGEVGGVLEMLPAENDQRESEDETPELAPDSQCGVPGGGLGRV